MGRGRAQAAYLTQVSDQRLGRCVVLRAQPELRPQHAHHRVRQARTHGAQAGRLVAAHLRRRVRGRGACMGSRAAHPALELPILKSRQEAGRAHVEGEQEAPLQTTQQ